LSETFSAVQEKQKSKRKTYPNVNLYFKLKPWTKEQGNFKQNTKIKWKENTNLN
jgi:hypothetical protein